MTKEKIKQIIYLILVVIWMSTIFNFSSQTGGESQGLSQKVTKAIVEIFTHNQNIEEAKKLELIENLDYYIRKLAHFSIYALGGILIYNYINTYNLSKKIVIIISILIGAIYAMTDEFHQIFTSGRSANLLDVLIDSSGIIVGVTLKNLMRKLEKP